MPYRTLAADKIVETIDRLRRRIDERFPNRGLVGVCAELADIARRDEARAARMARPFYSVRIAVGSLIALGATAQIWLAQQMKLPALMNVLAGGAGQADVVTLVGGAEAAVNLLVLFGAAVFFLTTLEERIKRRLVLDDLHELRSIVHVIDMHQLTKDPGRLLHRGPDTASSPKESMTPFELGRYLDYCSEMLSLIGKVAALYAQNARDPVVIDAVNDIEGLTTNLSRKIWQKIMIVERLAGDEGARASNASFA